MYKEKQGVTEAMSAGTQTKDDVDKILKMIQQIIAIIAVAAI